MIVYDLRCPDEHRFEGWFSSSEDFASQNGRGLITCPHCGSAEIDKAPMAPAVPRKGNQVVQAQPAQKADMVLPSADSAPSPEMAAMFEKIAALQAEMLKESHWVGDDFAEQSRAMHYGEREAATIHGRTSVQQAKELLEEGIPVAPLPLPVAPPEELN